MKLLSKDEYLFLKEEGVDITKDKIDFKCISVRCEDLSLYRKALRVKIRALIKTQDLRALRQSLNALYALAEFSKHLYGFHSCSSAVSPFQEKEALDKQGKFKLQECKVYDGKVWLDYSDVHVIKLAQGMQNPVEDKKPFLSLKDKAHFDQCLSLQMKEE